MADPNLLSRIALLAIGFATLAGLRADEPAKPSEKTPADAKASRKLDLAKLPPGAVIIVSDNPREAFQNVDAIVLSLDEYKKLLDAAGQARRAAVPERPDVPSVCRLSVRVESRGGRDVATVKAAYQFRTTSPRATVALGLQNGKPRSASLDGQLAALLPAKDDDGFVVQAESAGEHTLTIEIEAPLTSRTAKPGERGFEIGLPGAAITTLERADLPDGASRARIGGRSVPVGQLAPTNGPALVLGPAPRLEMVWEGPSPIGQAAPLFSADAKIDVRFDEKQVATKTRLTVKVLRGAAGQIALLVPRDTEVTVDRSADNSLTIAPPASDPAPWVIRREASAADLTINLVAKATVAPGQPVRVIPPNVVGAVLQRGVIAVGGSQNVRLTFTVPPTADSRRRESTDDAPRDALFSYQRLADAGSVLDVAVHALRGQIETQIAHQLTLGERGWLWHGKFDVRPVRTEISQLDVEWPAELADPLVASSDIVEGVSTLRDLGGGRRLLRIAFAENRRKPTTFALDGVYRATPPGSPVTLPLPRVVGMVDRGGQVSVATMPGYDVRASIREINVGGVEAPERFLEPGPRGAGSAAVATERAVAFVRAAYGPVVRDVPVTATVDVRLAERQAAVRCQWRLPAQGLPPGALRIRAPASVAGRLRGIDGATVAPANAGLWSLQLPAGEPGKIATASVTYSIPFPAAVSSAAVPIPLVWLDGFAAVETDVRIWPATTPNGSVVPVRVEGPWTEVPPQPAADVSLLPAMTLHASGADRALGVAFETVGPGPLHALPVERVLVQVLVEDDGRQVYRQRALLRLFGVFQAELVLPEPAVACQFQAMFDGQRLNWHVTDPGGRVVRLRVDVEAGKASGVLDLSYILARDTTRPWVSEFRPPQWRGAAGMPAARWQIGLPEGRTGLALDSAADFADRWTWSRGLLAVQPEWTAAGLQRWINGGLRPSELESTANENSLNVWAPAEQRLRFLVAPRAVVFLICSLMVVGAALALFSARPLARAVLAIVLVGMATALAIARPQIATVLAIGCQPGAIVFALVLTARGIIRRRYDRRLIFLPRGDVAAPSRPRIAREPSTIDAPASAT